MAESTAPTYLTNLFKNGVYCVTVDGQPYDSDAVYSTDATYRVALTDPTLKDKLPLALLFATMQIALADVSACKAESFMNKIQQNQDTQVACSKAINEAKKMQETSIDSVSGFVAANPSFIMAETLQSSYFTFTFDPADAAAEALIAPAVTEKLKASLSALDLNDTGTCNITTSEYPPLVTFPPATSGADVQNVVETVSYQYDIGLTGVDSKGMKCTYTCTVSANYKTDIVYKSIDTDTREDKVYYDWVATRSNETTGPTISTKTLTETPDTSSSSIYGTALPDDFVELCYAAGVSEIDGVTIYTTKSVEKKDENGNAILDKDGVPIMEEIPVSANATLSDKQLEALISELEIVQEAASSTLQTDMVYAEDYLGQYNAYLNGGSSNIDDLTNALQTIAQRI